MKGDKSGPSFLAVQATTQCLLRIWLLMLVMLCGLVDSTNVVTTVLEIAGTRLHIFTG